MDMGRPEGRLTWVSRAHRPDGVVQGGSRMAHPWWGSAVIGEVGVKVDRQLCGGGVLDGP
jgi:hypothetical protein